MANVRAYKGVRVCEPLRVLRRCSLLFEIEVVGVIFGGVEEEFIIWGEIFQ